MSKLFGKVNLTADTVTFGMLVRGFKSTGELMDPSVDPF